MAEQARLGESADRVRTRMLLRGRARGGEAREPRRERGTRVHGDRAVAVEQAAEALGERSARRERLRMTGTDEAGVSLGAARAERRPALEQRHARAAARELERRARADRTAADHDDVAQ